MYKIGDIVEGMVTGIQPYGVFLSLKDDQQGLIHISECTHGYLQNVHTFVKVGEVLKAMVIDVDEYTKKVSLSLRALEKIPIPKYPVKKKRRRTAYSNQLGFDTLRKKMPLWIEEAQEMIDNKETAKEQDK